jgi:hypothetical protein
MDAVDILENDTIDEFLDEESDPQRNLDGNSALENSVRSKNRSASNEWQELMGEDLLLQVNFLHVAYTPHRIIRF